MKLDSSYFLVAHGSRDPRHQFGIEKVAHLLYTRLATLSEGTLSPSDIAPRVGSGTLELNEDALHQQLCLFGEYTLSLGLTEVQILPLFLLLGVHVKDDIPAEVAIAQEILGQKVKLNLRAHLGSQKEGLIDWVNREIETVSPQTQWILLAHGSRRVGGNATVEEVAQKVGAISAYWAVSPSLEQQVHHLVRDGHYRIGILPYFLFSGAITDAIVQQVKQLKEQYHAVEFYLTNPLDANHELINLVWNLID